MEKEFEINKKNYVDFAEQSLLEYQKKLTGKKDTDENKNLTSTKLRKILNLSAKIYNDIRLLETWDESLTDSFQYLKLRCVYEAGRDKDSRVVDYFLTETKIIEFINFILRKEDLESALLFCKYMEALVAYHKFYSK